MSGQILEKEIQKPNKHTNIKKPNKPTKRCSLLLAGHKILASPAT